MRKTRGGLLVTLIAAASGSAAADTTWKTHAIGEYGISVALPSAPSRRSLPVPEAGVGGALLVYEAFEPREKLTKYSIFVSEPEKGIFEPASMDAFLTGHVTSLVRAAESPSLRSATRTTFLGLPAMAYVFDHAINGEPYVARGVTVMVDGGYMRLSMWHPRDAVDAEANFAKFRDSFVLGPITYRPAPAVQLAGGVNFQPPQGWKQQAPQNAAQLARYSHLTRSMQLLWARDASYDCTAHERAVSSSGRLRGADSVTLNGRPFRRLTSFEDLPKYNVRLATVQYCQNTGQGALVLGASEEDSRFSRWAQVFEGAAASLRAR